MKCVEMLALNYEFYKKFKKIRRKKGFSLQKIMLKRLTVFSENTKSRKHEIKFKKNIREKKNS